MVGGRFIFLSLVNLVLSCLFIIFIGFMFGGLFGIVRRFGVVLVFGVGVSFFGVGVLDLSLGVEDLLF